MTSPSTRSGRGMGVELTDIVAPVGGFHTSLRTRSATPPQFRQWRHPADHGPAKASVAVSADGRADDPTDLRWCQGNPAARLRLSLSAAFLR